MEVALLQKKLERFRVSHCRSKACFFEIVVIVVVVVVLWATDCIIERFAAGGLQT